MHGAGDDDLFGAADFALVAEIDAFFHADDAARGAEAPAIATRRAKDGRRAIARDEAAHIGVHMEAHGKGLAFLRAGKGAAGYRVPGRAQGIFATQVLAAGLDIDPPFVDQAVAPGIA